MLVACLEWRRTVEGKGLTTLYKEMDPFDVCHSQPDPFDMLSIG